MVNHKQDVFKCEEILSIQNSDRFHASKKKRKLKKGDTKRCLENKMEFDQEKDNISPKCSICKKIFKTKENLAQHLRAHNNKAI